MKLSVEQVRHVARLARLALTPLEEERYARQLSAILGYAEELAAVDTSHIEPTAHASDIPNLLRADELRPSLSPEEAAGLVVDAIVRRPVRIATRLGVFGAVCHAVAPRLTQVLLNTAFNMFPDSAAAQGKKEAPPQALTAEQMAFAQLTQGIHW
jgi:aspartyl/glutamyl-tRNA(Asn/Gln) amidotransferase C subunit